MHTLENSSSSDEDIENKFHMAKAKSRSNASLSLTVSWDEFRLLELSINFSCNFQNQSGIYYDVDYDFSGVEHVYGTTTDYNSYTNKQDSNLDRNKTTGSAIPMTTYSSSRSTYYK